MRGRSLHTEIERVTFELCDQRRRELELAWKAQKLASPGGWEVVFEFVRRADSRSRTARMVVRIQDAPGLFEQIASFELLFTLAPTLYRANFRRLEACRCLSVAFNLPETALAWCR
jgi:hypothetical protein